jgi:hypothetical protein
MVKARILNQQHSLARHDAIAAVLDTDRAVAQIINKKQG